MKYTPEEIKNRLSNIGEAIGTISLEYIVELEKENKQLKAQIEEMKCCFNCDRPIKHHDCGDCHNGSNWKLAESDRLIRS